MAWRDFQRAFFDRIWPLTAEASARTGVPRETIFAQAALESNWGRSAPNNNFFGIKGPGGTQTTREYVNGQWVTIQDSFRGYGSIAESVNGWVITNPRSRRWGDARSAGSPEEAARALQAGGYATDPDYASKLISVIRNIPAELLSGGSAAPTGGSGGNPLAPVSPPSKVEPPQSASASTGLATQSGVQYLALPGPSPTPPELLEFWTSLRTYFQSLPSSE